MLFFCRYKERRWDPKQLIGSGGMPSSHSATVTALAAAIGFHEGFGGPLFATALVLACIVCLQFFMSINLWRFHQVLYILFVTKCDIIMMRFYFSIYALVGMVMYV